MKRKLEDRYHSFRPVKLCREEIDEVVAILKNSCKTVELSDDKHVYESLDEIEERLGKSLPGLNIVGSDPYIAVRLGTRKVTKWLWSDENRLYASNDERAQIPFFKTRDVISEHQRIIERFFNYRVFLLILVSDFLFGWFAHYRLHLSSDTGAFVSWARPILVIAYVISFTYFNFRGISRLSLTPRGKRQSFWDRNGDNLAMAVLGAAIGVFGTLAAEWLKHIVISK